MSRFLPPLLLALLLAPPAAADTITCLGRIEPLDGVRVLAGPSGSGAATVISEVRVKEGDWVKKDQVLAVLDDHGLRQAELEQHRELLEEAKVNLNRLENLGRSQTISRSKLDEARYRFSSLQAGMGVYEARLEMSFIRAPHRGQVLKIFTQPGEKVGPDGVLELGETDKMTVVAEVYETDVHRLAEGQKAIISTPALSESAHGKVIRVGFRIGKMDVLSSDPVADTDARVVETTILVDDPEPLKRLTNLQVDVEILP
jgi:multidrug efflux pump subunit AcrA (membrane-fusion protein)